MLAQIPRNNRGSCRRGWRSRRFPDRDNLRRIPASPGTDVGIHGEASGAFLYCRPMGRKAHEGKAASDDRAGARHCGWSHEQASRSRIQIRLRLALDREREAWSSPPAPIEGNGRYSNGRFWNACGKMALCARRAGTKLTIGGHPMQRSERRCLTTNLRGVPALGNPPSSAPPQSEPALVVSVTLSCENKSVPAFWGQGDSYGA